MFRIYQTSLQAAQRLLVNKNAFAYDGTCSDRKGIRVRLARSYADRLEPRLIRLFSAAMPKVCPQRCQAINIQDIENVMLTRLPEAVSEISSLGARDVIRLVARPNKFVSILYRKIFGRPLIGGGSCPLPPQSQ